MTFRMNPSAPLWQTRLPATLRPSEKLAVLLQSPSLTAALRALPCEFSVRLLHLGLGDGSLLLDSGGPGKSYFCRDVELCLNGEPVVWARSQCLPSSGYWRQMLDCGSRPLGDRLFAESADWQRSPLEFAALEGIPLPSVQNAQLARRSFFQRQNETLGLVECFLPALAGYL